MEHNRIKLGSTWHIIPELSEYIPRTSRTLYRIVFGNVILELTPDQAIGMAAHVILDLDPDWAIKLGTLLTKIPKTKKWAGDKNE